MSKQKVTIQFKNVHLLWNYAQTIECHSMEILAGHMILICECSETDIAMLEHYGGVVIEDYHSVRERNISQTNKL